MTTQIIGVVVIFLATILLAIPLGKYIAKVYHGQRTWLDPVLVPIEKFIYKVCRIDPERQMTWKRALLAFLTLNFIWFIWGMVVFVTQQWVFWNPMDIGAMDPDLAFNTTISFLVNCNLQHYYGALDLSYWAQLGGISYLQYVTPASGMAAAALVFNAVTKKSAEKLGNFYRYFVRSLLWVLIPLGIVLGAILIFNGTPMTWQEYPTYTTLEGYEMTVGTGPVAAEVTMKQLGTNGGGYYSANYAHPYENPTYFTTMAGTIALLLIAMAMIFAFGYYTKKKKVAWMIFSVMLAFLTCSAVLTITAETGGNPAIAEMGVSQELGNMEGKEIRIGSATTALYTAFTTASSNGSVAGMHDSLMPLAGMAAMLNMMINAVFSGLGAGFMNFYLFIIIGIFISGLMVGRTPEFLNKKIEAREMKVAVISVLVHPAIILTGTAVAAYVYAQNPGIGWLNNYGFHGFSEMLYEYTSAAANNGSGFEGLGDDNPFWNITTGIVLFLGRYITIIGAVAIAGMLAKKKYIPESAGTLKAGTVTFGVIMFAVIFILAALAFFPALVYGPIGEFFKMQALY